MRVVLILAALAGCGRQAPPVQAPPTQSAPTTTQKPTQSPSPPVYSIGDHVESIDENKVQRSYIVRVPTGYDHKRPLPLVMFLHGWTGSAKLSEAHTGMGKEADKGHFLLVLPDGLGKPQGWNCGFLNLGAKGVDDVQFLTDVLDAVGKKVKVDPSRVYVAGYSNGAMMAYVMGSKLSTRIAAIGVVSGTIGFDRGSQIAHVEPPANPVSAIIIHGLLDPTVPYSHGAGLLENSTSAPDSAAFWAKADGIATNPTVTVAAKGNLEQRDWKAGPIEVKLISIANGTHDWPGGVNWEGPETKTGFDAATQLWGFFASHRRPG
jgi:polyhydroxybutyrate depolymerase